MVKLLALLFVVCPFFVLADNIKVALIKIPGVLEHDKPLLPYSKLVTVLRNKLEIDVLFLPSARANKLLNSQKLECIFPLLPTNTRSMPTIISEPVNGIKAYAFTTDGTIYKTLESLHGRTVVFLRGYVFGGLVNRNQGLNFFPVMTQKAAIGVLEKSRADAYIDYLPDLRFALSKQELASLTYDPNYPIIKSNDVFECIENEKTKGFIKGLNKALISLKNSGEMEFVLGDYFVETN